MERREFLAAGAVLVTSWRAGPGGRPPRGNRPAGPHRQGGDAPTLPAEVFARRLARAQDELAARGWAVLLATPSANYQYLAGDNPGRSERLIALLVPASGAPVVVGPAFEVERLRRHGAVADVRGWEEQEDPYRLVRDTVRSLVPAPGVLALEPSTTYETYRRLADALPAWRFVDAAPLTERLRLVKSAEEVALIRRAIAITQAAMAATFAQLAAGMTERDVARVLAREMQQRGAEGGGLVQFGPASALPHGGPAATPLARETAVLIDCGCRVAGYTSDITRTVWFGDHPPEEFRRVFAVVHDAQSAALRLGRPGLPCQALDRAARRVIADAGYARFFTHRLGHGIGLEGHEPPYLVEGNAMPLEPGMVFTIEPGIYQPGRFGVRIEDDCLMTEAGVALLSERAAPL
jgi:Xaa-Pro dipeptidase